jgi:hypothetical protein
VNSGSRIVKKIRLGGAFGPGTFAHSALVRGAGIVAAGPYFCAEASLRHALGCWDWWGYEGEAYATQAGPQVRAVRSMIADLLGEPAAAAR